MVGTTDIECAGNAAQAMPRATPLLEDDNHGRATKVSLRQVPVSKHQWEKACAEALYDILRSTPSPEEIQDDNADDIFGLVHQRVSQQHQVPLHEILQCAPRKIAILKYLEELVIQSRSVTATNKGNGGTTANDKRHSENNPASKTPGRAVTPATRAITPSHFTMNINNDAMTTASDLVACVVETFPKTSTAAEVPDEADSDKPLKTRAISTTNFDPNSSRLKDLPITLEIPASVCNDPSLNQENTALTLDVEKVQKSSNADSSTEDTARKKTRVVDSKKMEWFNDLDNRTPPFDSYSRKRFLASVENKLKETMQLLSSYDLTTWKDGCHKQISIVKARGDPMKQKVEAWKWLQENFPQDWKSSCKRKREEKGERCDWTLAELIKLYNGVQKCKTTKGKIQWIQISHTFFDGARTTRQIESQWRTTTAPSIDVAQTRIWTAEEDQILSNLPTDYVFGHEISWRLSNMDRASARGRAVLLHAKNTNANVAGEQDVATRHSPPIFKHDATVGSQSKIVALQENAVSSARVDGMTKEDFFDRHFSHWASEFESSVGPKDEKGDAMDKPKARNEATGGNTVVIKGEDAPTSDGDARNPDMEQNDGIESLSPHLSAHTHGSISSVSTSFTSKGTSVAVIGHDEMSAVVEETNDQNPTNEALNAHSDLDKAVSGEHTKSNMVLTNCEGLIGNPRDIDKETSDLPVEECVATISSPTIDESAAVQEHDSLDKRWNGIDASPDAIERDDGTDFFNVYIDDTGIMGDEFGDIII